VITLSPDDLLWQLAVPTRLGERPGLDRMRQLLAALGDPQRGLPVLHIGGTSGKGSTATIAATILQAAGYRVGLHVKPHLERVEERFVVNGVSIGPPRLVELIQSVAPSARKISPTWYELTVVVALQHFREERVDLAVVEVGMGGTFDGTNVVEPLATILTNVGLDHTEVLGDTVEKIAVDKAGIIKRGAMAVCGATQPSVRRIVAERCSRVGTDLWQLDQEFRYDLLSLRQDGGSFDLDLPTRRLGNLEVALRGAHQVANAALAIAGVEAIGRAFPVSELALRRALATVEVPGRLEVVRREPLIVLDGAHNPAKMAALVDALEALFPKRPTTAVLAFKRGHDLGATMAALLPRLQRAILTRFDADTDFGRGQSVDPAVVDAACAELGARLERIVEPDPVRAVELAIELARPEDLICVTGSLYLVGAVRPWLGRAG